MTIATLTQQDTIKEDAKEGNQLVPNCFILAVKGDPKFRINKTSARKEVSGKVNFISKIEGWAYQNRTDAEKVAARWTKGKRAVVVRDWYNSIVDDLWYGSPIEQNQAAKKIAQGIEREKLNEKLRKIEIECQDSGLHPSWLISENLPEDFSETEKKAHQHYKPLFDIVKSEEELLELHENDLKLLGEDVQQAEKIPEIRRLSYKKPSRK